jgi:succinate dehydrogenase/fumarate reductase flavoprotein subunit
MHIERSKKGLEGCLEVTAEVVKDFQNVSIPGNSLRYNDAWVTAMEVRTRMLVGEIMTRASLFRTESRSALFREEYPQVNRKEWDKNLVVNKENGQVNLETRPVVTTIWPLEEIDLPLFPVPGEEHPPGAKVLGSGEIICDTRETE